MGLFYVCLICPTRRQSKTGILWAIIKTGLIVTDKPEHSKIDTKIPITWLLSSAGGIIVAIASLIYQLQINTLVTNEVKISLAELKQLQNKRDDRIISLSEYDIESRNQILNIQTQIAKLTIEFAEMRKEQYQFNNKNRYLPLK